MSRKEEDEWETDMARIGALSISAIAYVSRGQIVVARRDHVLKTSSLRFGLFQSESLLGGF